MTLTENKEKVEEIIKKISITEVDYSKSIDDCLVNVVKNPSLTSLRKEKKKLLVRKDFNDRKWIDPQKILMAITPGVFLICLAAPPAVFGLLTLLYLI